MVAKVNAKSKHDKQQTNKQTKLTQHLAQMMNLSRSIQIVWPLTFHVLLSANRFCSAFVRQWQKLRGESEGAVAPGRSARGEHNNRTESIFD